MFTVMFAFVGRLPGWISQWKEMRLMGDPIGRPRQSLPRCWKKRLYSNEPKIISNIS